MNALETIAAGAAKRSLSFLLAGGHAVVTHGHPRNTFDLDLIIRREEREQWVKLVGDIGYILHHEGPTFLQFNPQQAELLPLDLMMVGTETFSKLLADSVSAPNPALAARVVSLRHLLALKCHAIKHGHPGRIVKDVDDVISLVQTNRLDVSAAEIRDLILKHGTTELYEKVKRVCVQD